MATYGELRRLWARAVLEKAHPQVKKQIRAAIDEHHRAAVEGLEAARRELYGQRRGNILDPARVPLPKTPDGLPRSKDDVKIPGLNLAALLRVDDGSTIVDRLALPADPDRR